MNEKPAVRTLTPLRLGNPPPSAPLPTRVLVPGPQGPAPKVSAYNEMSVAPINGVLTLDASRASTFYITMDQDISAIHFTHLPPPGKTEHISLVCLQDDVGGRRILSTAWPAGSEAPNGLAPVLSTAPHSKDIAVVIISTNNIHVALAGKNYLPINP